VVLVLLDDGEHARWRLASCGAGRHRRAQDPSVGVVESDLLAHDRHDRHDRLARLPRRRRLGGWRARWERRLSLDEPTRYQASAKSVQHTIPREKGSFSRVAFGLPTTTPCRTVAPTQSPYLSACYRFATMSVCSRKNMIPIRDGRSAIFLRHFPISLCMGLSLSREHHAIFCRPFVIPFFCSTRAASILPSRPHTSIAVARSGGQGRCFFSAAEGLSLTDVSTAAGSLAIGWLAAR
jgi:hypothetical protein